MLRRLRNEPPGAIYGANLPDNFPGAFRLSAKYGAKFIRFGSVCGRLSPGEDAIRGFRTNSGGTAAQCRWAACD